jgi:hypothetical protein
MRHDVTSIHGGPRCHISAIRIAKSSRWYLQTVLTTGTAVRETLGEEEIAEAVISPIAG